MTENAGKSTHSNLNCEISDTRIITNQAVIRVKMWQVLMLACLLRFSIGLNLQYLDQISR